jgi:hypothetical protein
MPQNSGYSRPPLVQKKPVPRCTCVTAAAIRPTTNAATTRVAGPTASISPPCGTST